MVLLLMPILDTVDILDLLDTLDTVPMVPILMLVLMVATTLARGLLMLSQRLMLMLTMVPMDTLPTVLIAILDKKEASIPCSMNNNNFTQKLSI